MLSYNIENTEFKNLSLLEAIKIGLKPEYRNNKIFIENIAGLSCGYKTGKEVLINTLCSYLIYKIKFIFDTLEIDYNKYLDRIKPLIHNYTLNSLDSLLKILSLVINNLDDIKVIEKELDEITKKLYNSENLIPLDKLDLLNLNNYDK